MLTESISVSFSPPVALQTYNLWPILIAHNGLMYLSYIVGFTRFSLSGFINPIKSKDKLFIGSSIDATALIPHLRNAGYDLTQI